MSADSSRGKLVRWCKFNLVGGMGIVVQFAALFLLKSALHFNYLAATAIAVEAAVVHNFVWHEQFTWADRMKADPPQTLWRRSLARFVRFHLTNGAVSIAGNLAALWKPVVHVFGRLFRLFDIGGAIGLAGMGLMVVVFTMQNTIRLYREERIPQ